MNVTNEFHFIFHSFSTRMINGNHEKEGTYQKLKVCFEAFFVQLTGSDIVNEVSQEKLFLDFFFSADLI